jgi:hypothetical protein
MNSTITFTQKQLFEFLLNVAIVRPVFIWGPPGVGKSAIVQEFAHQLGLPCVSLLGSQLAPEDIIGVPQIEEGTSRFCPPRMIARTEPYCLFLDELNACSTEVQKAFYSLIHERRIGEYYLPQGSIVVGAGNRIQDNAIVKPMSSALLNRMVHIHLRVSSNDWLEWGGRNGLHSLVLSYIQLRPDQLWTQPGKQEEPFSSPRSWHMLSDALHSFGEGLADEWLEGLAYGCLTPEHASQFCTFVKRIMVRSEYKLEAILRGEVGWPRAKEDRDILYFLIQAFRAYLIKELPTFPVNGTLALAIRAKSLIKELSSISMELVQLIVANQGQKEGSLPGWFIVELTRELPSLLVG